MSDRAADLSGVVTREEQRGLDQMIERIYTVVHEPPRQAGWLQRLVDRVVPARATRYRDRLERVRQAAAQLERANHLCDEITDQACYAKSQATRTAWERRERLAHYLRTRHLAALVLLAREGDRFRDGWEP